MITKITRRKKFVEFLLPSDIDISDQMSIIRLMGTHNGRIANMGVIKLDNNKHKLIFAFPDELSASGAARALRNWE